MTHSYAARVGAVAVLGAALTLVFVSGCATRGDAVDTPVPAAPTASAPSPSAVAAAPIATDIPRTDIDSRAAPQGPPPEAPDRESVASLQIDMPVVPVGLAAGGDVSIPSASHTAGWYEYSSGYTGRSGTIVVVAHVDAWDGIGPFSRLKAVSASAEVVLTGPDGPRTFRVDGVAQPQKGPGSLAGYFVGTGPAKLVLITCGGSFDEATGHYRDNIVVTASPNIP